MDTQLVITIIVLGLGSLVGLELLALMWAYRHHADRHAPRALRESVARRRVARSRFWFRRVSALEAVSLLPPDVRAPIYAEVLTGPRRDHLTATPAAMALAELRGGAAVAPIVAAIDDGRLPAFAGAAALQVALPAGEAELCAHLVSGHGTQTLRALAAALGEAGAESGVFALGTLFTAATAPEVRLSAAEALLASSLRGVRVTADLCLGLVADPDPRVRVAAAPLLCRVAGDDARSILVGMLEDPSWHVARAAAGALCDLPGGEGAAEEIMDGLSQSVIWERRAWELIEAELEIRAPEPDEESPTAEESPAMAQGPEWVAV